MRISIRCRAWLAGLLGAALVAGTAAVAPSAGAASNVQGVSLTSNGYVSVSGAGGVAAFNATNRGNPSGFSGGIVDISATPDGGGYAAVSSAGQVYAYGSVVSRGNPSGFGGVIADIAVTADGKGYVVVSSTGQVYAFGTVTYRGNPTGFTGSIVSIAVTADGKGYIAMSSTGQTYAYGTVVSRGNPTGYSGLMIDIAVTGDGAGYAALSSRGQVYAFGTVTSRGNPYDMRGTAAGISVLANGAGYAVVTDQGQVHTFGTVTYRGDYDNVAIQGSSQHLNANRHVTWGGFPSAGSWNLDQTLWVVTKGASSYWSSSFDWKQSSGAATGGYLGLQTNGNRVDNSVGDTAIFSLWGANATRNGSCQTFTGEGAGRSCRLPYTIYGDGNSYRLRVWRLEADSGGQWWGAWVQDSRRGDVEIGEIRVPTAANLIASTMNFSEYFGTKVDCDSLPFSQVNWNYPKYNGSAGTASYASTTKGSCTGGAAIATANGDGSATIRTTLGGRRPGS